ncbi:MAG: GGDEF domain-containing protein [Deltaproteobacteria bacterium]|nr:MAG: GGDEF domain-containing protein [Deltaproteobacteria bacterium]
MGAGLRRGLPARRRRARRRPAPAARTGADPGGRAGGGVPPDRGRFRRGRRTACEHRAVGRRPHGTGVGGRRPRLTAGFGAAPGSWAAAARNGARAPGGDARVRGVFAVGSCRPGDPHHKVDGSMSKTTILLDGRGGGLARGTPGRKRAFVVVLAGDRMGEMFPLEGGRVTIGRGLKADVRINDEGISRTHAVVEYRDGEYVLLDAGSTNGTYANGERIDEHVLVEGDKIQIGASSVLKFTFHDELDEDFQRTLYESALRDRVTGVFNRSYFNNRLESDVAFALRHGKPLALVMIDLDHFKRVNDTYGHPAGDALLREFAARVHATTRSEDVFARYGGEEFALICRDVDARKALFAAERILGVITKEPFSVGDAELEITASLGVADLGQLPQPSADQLVRAADAALYRAKAEGRARIVVFDPNADPTRLV